MKIKVSELEEQGLSVTDTSAVEHAFSDASWRLEAVSLQIDPDGSDVRVHGHLRATVPQTCGRCLEPFPAGVDAPVDVTLQPRPATGDTVELGVDDLDVDFTTTTCSTSIAGGNGNHAGPAHEPLCRDDCRGLCPGCAPTATSCSARAHDRAPDPRLFARSATWPAPAH